MAFIALPQPSCIFTTLLYSKEKHLFSNHARQNRTLSNRYDHEIILKISREQVENSVTTMQEMENQPRDVFTHSIKDDR